jgi:hypothetical protein
MATKGEEVHALEKKVRIMAETLCEIGRIRSVSRCDFAETSDIDYDTLKAAWRSGRLSTALQSKLAEAAGFDLSDPAWIDDSIDPSIRTLADNADYPGRDTAANFRAMLRRSHELPGSGTVIRVANQRPKLIDSNLATFSVEDTGQGAALGDPMPMFFSIVLECGYHPKGIEYGFNRVRLRVVFDEQSEARLQERLGDAIAVQINGAILEARGNEHHPEWFLHSAKSALQGQYTTNDEPLCVLVGSQLGEEFQAEMSVRPMDGTLVAVNGQPLQEILKKRIIELLCAKKLPGVKDTQGWISLGTQLLSIVRADRT